MEERYWEEGDLDWAVYRSSSDKRGPVQRSSFVSPHLIKFPIQAVYDVLPSPPDTRHQYALCVLSEKPWNTSSSAAPGHSEMVGEAKGMTQSWRALLKPSVQDLDGKSCFQGNQETITFVRAVEQPNPARRTPAGPLTFGRDWQLLVDLEHHLKFPSNSAVTNLQPDIVLVSEFTRQLVLMELTVPWEDRLEDALKRKLSKYAGLVRDCQQAGWRVKCLPVEGGCRGFAAHFLTRAFSCLGIKGERRRAIHSTTDAAERASRCPCLKKGDHGVMVAS